MTRNTRSQKQQKPKTKDLTGHNTDHLGVPPKPKKTFLDSQRVAKPNTKKPKTTHDHEMDVDPAVAEASNLQAERNIAQDTYGPKQPLQVPSSSSSERVPTPPAPQKDASDQQPRDNLSTDSTQQRNDDDQMQEEVTPTPVISINKEKKYTIAVIVEALKGKDKHQMYKSFSNAVVKVNPNLLRSE